MSFREFLVHQHHRLHTYPRVPSHTEIECVPTSKCSNTNLRFYPRCRRSFYGLHQFFLTESAVYVIVPDATKIEGLNGKDLDEVSSGLV